MSPSPKPLTAKCPVCKKPLIRNGNSKEGVWYEHETTEFGPRVVVFEDDLSAMEPKPLLALMQRFHKESVGPHAPPGGGSDARVERDPAIKVDLDPTFVYEPDKEGV